MQFGGQVAWVTGASSGLGRALALELARRGADLAVSARRTGLLEDLALEIQALGRRCVVVPCDVTDEDQVFAAASRVVEALGQMDVVVANAGYGVQGPCAEVSLAHWERQLDVNVLGVVRTLHAALPHITARKGRLVIMGSASAFAWFQGFGAYQVSKAALRPLAYTLDAELHGTGVTTTLIHPGFVESEIAQVDNDGVRHPERQDPRPARFMWTSERAARRMADIIHRRPLERTYTGVGWVVSVLAMHAPGLLQLLSRRQAPV